MVQRLANVRMEKALSEGCMSWVGVLFTLLSVPLQSACTARAKGYTGTEFLCFEDVESPLDAHRQQESLSSPFNGPAGFTLHLRGKITIKYRKGSK